MPKHGLPKESLPFSWQFSRPRAGWRTPEAPSYWFIKEKGVPMASVKLDSILENRRCEPGELIEVLQDAQESFNYLPEHVLCEVSERLGVPLIEVFRVANFYKAFSLTPRGPHLLTICLGTACHVRGASRMLDEIEGQLGVSPGGTTKDKVFTVDAVNCVGCCALGPIVIMDGEYHDHMSPNKLRRLIKTIGKIDTEVPADA